MYACMEALDKILLWPGNRLFEYLHNKSFENDNVNQYIEDKNSALKIAPSDIKNMFTYLEENLVSSPFLVLDSYVFVPNWNKKNYFLCRRVFKREILVQQHSFAPGSKKDLLDQLYKEVQQKNIQGNPISFHDAFHYCIKPFQVSQKEAILSNLNKKYTKALDHKDLSLFVRCETQENWLKVVRVLKIIAWISMFVLDLKVCHRIYKNFALRTISKNALGIPRGLPYTCAMVFACLSHHYYAKRMLGSRINTIYKPFKMIASLVLFHMLYKIGNR